MLENETNLAFLYLCFIWFMKHKKRLVLRQLFFSLWVLKTGRNVLCNLWSMHSVLLLFWYLYVIMFKKYVRKNISRYSCNTHVPIAHQLQTGDLYFRMQHVTCTVSILRIKCVVEEYQSSDFLPPLDTPLSDSGLKWYYKCCISQCLKLFLQRLKYILKTKCLFVIDFATFRHMIL